LIYGMYYCFNIVTEAKNFPAAILIRAAEPINFKKEANGPGKLCRALKIDKTLNGENLITSKKLYLAQNLKSTSADLRRSKPTSVGEDRSLKERRQIKKAKRIGIDYAGKYKDKLWRFYLKNNQFVSKK